MDASNIEEMIRAIEEAYKYGIEQAMGLAIEQAQKSNRNFMTEYIEQAKRLGEIRDAALEAAKENKTAKCLEAAVARA